MFFPSSVREKASASRHSFSAQHARDVVVSQKDYSLQFINPLRGGGAEAPRPQSAVEASASIQGVDGILGELQSFLFSLDVRKRWSV